MTDYSREQSCYETIFRQWEGWKAVPMTRERDSGGFDNLIVRQDTHNNWMITRIDSMQQQA